VDSFARRQTRNCCYPDSIRLPASLPSPRRPRPFCLYARPRVCVSIRGLTFRLGGAEWCPCSSSSTCCFVAVPEVDWDAGFTSVEAQAEFRKKYTEALRQTPDEANERRLMDRSSSKKKSGNAMWLTIPCSGGCTFSRPSRGRKPICHRNSGEIGLARHRAWNRVFTRGNESGRGAGLVLPNGGVSHDWKESGPKGERASAKPGRLSAVPLGTKVQRGG